MFPYLLLPVCLCLCFVDIPFLSLTLNVFKSFLLLVCALSGLFFFLEIRSLWNRGKRLKNTWNRNGSSFPYFLRIRKEGGYSIYRDPGDPFHHPHYCQKGEYHHPPIIFIPFAPPASSTHFLNMILWRSSFVAIYYINRAVWVSLLWRK